MAEPKTALTVKLDEASLFVDVGGEVFTAPTAPTVGIETTAASLVTAPTVNLMPFASTARARNAASAPLSLASAATVTFLREEESAGEESDDSIADAPARAADTTSAVAAATASALALPGAVAAFRTAAAIASGPFTHALEGTATVDVTVCITLPASVSTTLDPSSA